MPRGESFSIVEEDFHLGTRPSTRSFVRWCRKLSAGSGINRNREYDPVQGDFRSIVEAHRNQTGPRSH